MNEVAVQLVVWDRPLFHTSRSKVSVLRLLVDCSLGTSTVSVVRCHHFVDSGGLQLSLGLWTIS